MTRTPRPATSTVAGKATPSRRCKVTDSRRGGRDRRSPDLHLAHRRAREPRQRRRRRPDTRAVRLGQTLGLVGTGDYGTATGTITYTDGTTQSFTLSFSDWYANSPRPGGDIRDTFPYHNSQTGKASNVDSFYYEAIPLKASKQSSTSRYPMSAKESQRIKRQCTSSRCRSASDTEQAHPLTRGLTSDRSKRYSPRARGGSRDDLEARKPTPEPRPVPLRD